MALGKGSRFAAFAARECAIIETIQTAPPAAPDPTPHELRARRKAAKRALRDLANATPDQVIFDTRPRDSRQSADDLEAQMREALGLGSEAPAKPATPETNNDWHSEALGELLAVIPSPTFGKTDAAREAERMQALLEQTRDALKVPTPEPEQQAPKPKPAKPRQFVKRRIEVILSVRNSMGAIVPFYYQDAGNSQLAAEIAAQKKARGFGLHILGTRKVSVIEVILDADASKGNAGKRAALPSHATH